MILRSAVWCLQIVTENESSGKTEKKTPRFHTLVSRKNIFSKGKENKVVKRDVCITSQLLRFLFCKLNVWWKKIKRVCIHVLLLRSLLFLLFYLWWFLCQYPEPGPQSVEKISLALLILYWYWYYSLFFSIYYSHLPMLHHFRQVTSFLCAFPWPFPRDSYTLP